MKVTGRIVRGNHIPIAIEVDRGKSVKYGNQVHSYEFQDLVALLLQYEDQTVTITVETEETS